MTLFTGSKADELNNSYLNVEGLRFVAFGSEQANGQRPQLVLPIYTTAERDALADPVAAAGELIYNSSTDKLNFYTGAAWEAVTSA